jgi:tetratricopeptide (TPR) repeat protein
MAESPASPATNDRGHLGTTLGLGALLVLLTLLVYWPALHGGLIVDDRDHITRPEWQSLAGLGRIWFEIGITSQYFPLLHTAFWLEHQLWGDAVFGYHLINVLQHATSALLVVAVLRRLAVPGAWLAGFIFALHPVAVESVAWIAEQKNTLSTLLGLAAVYVYLGFDQDRRPSRYWVAGGLFVCALLAKSITATFAPALLVIFWWQRGRLEWRRDVLPLVPWLAIGAVFGLFTAWYERVYANARGASFDLSLIDRTLIAGRALLFYVRTLVWPANLMFINPRWTPDATAVHALFPAAIVVIGVALVWLARGRRGPLAVFLLYVGLLLPTLGFLNINWFNFSFVADHFQYLPSIALIAGTATGLTLVTHRLLGSRTPIAIVVIGGLIAALCGLQTRQQSANYRDAETLYRRTIVQNPACWLAHNNLGAILLERGQNDAAIGEFLATLEARPNHVPAFNNLGLAFSRSRQHLPDAVRAYETSLQLKPNDPNISLQLAEVLEQMPERSGDAASAYRGVLQLASNTAEAHAGLARLLGAAGNLPAAMAEIQSAIRLAPRTAAFHSELAEMLVAANRGSEALSSLETVVRLQPDNADAHYNLANLLSDLPGRAADAVSHFEAALRQRPDDPAIHNNLALVLAELPGRRDEAIQHLHTVLRLAPNSAEGHFSFGRVLLTAPADEREALRHFEAAAQLRPEWEAAQRAIAQLRARIR